MELLTKHECELIIKKSVKYFQVLQNHSDLKVSILVENDETEETVEFLGALKTSFQHIESISPEVIYSNENVVVFEKVDYAEFPLNYNQVKKIIQVLIDLNVSHGMTLNHFQFNFNWPESKESKAFTEECKQQICRYKTVRSHGDLQVGNLVFNSEGACKLIKIEPDFYAPPLYDVLQLIYFNTNEDFPQKYLQNLVQLYCNQLRFKLKNVECPSDKDFEWLLKLLLPMVKLKAAEFKFSQKVKAISSNSRLLSREDCFEVVKNKLGSDKFNFKSYQVVPVGESNGFLGNYFKLEIKTNERTMNFFVKSMPQAGPSVEVVQDSDCFAKEIFIYKHLAVKMQNCGISTFGECLPECYFGRSDDVLVFEDLSLDNYRILPSQRPFDFGTLQMCMRKLAKFHGSLMVLQEGKGSSEGFSYKLYGKYLNELFFCRDGKHAGATLMRVGIDSILDIIDHFPEIDFGADFKAVVWPKLYDAFYDTVKPSTIFTNLLAHGDLWTNNILVQVKNDQVVDCRFIDFQAIRYCPPAHDFLSLLYLTSDRTNRLKYAEVMEDIYYEELGNVVRRLSGLDLKAVYPREELRSTVELMRPQMVLQAIIYYCFAMCTSEEIGQFLGDSEVHHRTFFVDRRDFVFAMCEKSKAYLEKLREGVLDLQEVSTRFRHSKE